MKRPRPMLRLMVTLFTLLSLAAAQEPDKTKPKPVAPPLEDKTVKSPHAIRLNGKELRYTATAGTLVMKKEDGTPRASIFSIAYTLDDGGDVAGRPLTFCFNGGPGSSSVWLHLGALGPRKVFYEPDGKPTPPP
ncbi:MAG: peptidase S10, partial [Acidobacteria bacterium]|nr:peptidase S10 [Acidobacteriota bacterium]